MKLGAITIKGKLARLALSLAVFSGLVTAGYSTGFNSTAGGTATVGSSGCDYTSLYDAATAFRGITLAGDWTLLIQSDLTESKNCSFANASCATTGFKLTVKPGPNVAPVVTFNKAADNAGVAPSGHFVIGCNADIDDALATAWNCVNTKNFTLDGSNNGTSSRDLTFKNTGQTAYTSRIVVLAGQSDGVTIKNMNIINSSNQGSATSSNWPYGICISGRLEASTSYVPKNWTIDNCLVDCCTGANAYSQGIVLTSSGSITSLISGWTIRNCEIYGKNRGVVLDYLGDGNLLNNTIRSYITRTGTNINNAGLNQVACLYMNGTITGDTGGHTYNIIGNNMVSFSSNYYRGAYGQRCIYIATTQYDFLTNKCNIRNNMMRILCTPQAALSGSGTIIMQCAYLYSLMTYDFSNNSVYLPSVAAYEAAGDSTTQFCVGGMKAGNYKITLNNNILCNMHNTGAAINRVNAPTTLANFSSDNNVIWTPGGTAYTGRFGATPCLTLATWQGQTPAPDLASTQVDPTAGTNKWVNPATTNLHFSGDPGSSFKFARLAAVTTDYDNDSRPATTYAGADEGVFPTMVANTLAFATRGIGNPLTTYNGNITVQNTGATDALTVRSIVKVIQSSGAQSSPQIQIASVSLPITIAAGSSQTIPVQFTPTAAGAQTAIFRLFTDDPNNPTKDVTVTGTGAVPTITAPAAVSLPAMQPYTVSGEASFTVSGTNLVPTPSGDLVVTAPSGFEVSLTSGSGFGPSVTVPAPAAGGSASSTVYVRFQGYDVEGTYTDNVTVASNNAVTKNVALSATVDGTAPSSSASAGDVTQVGSMAISFTASDAGSGVASTKLFVKGPGDTSFADSGLAPKTGVSGSFTYTPASSGVYEFYTIATDAALNAEDAPGSADVAITYNPTANAAMTATIATGTDTLVFPMTSNLDVKLTFGSATVGGTVTVARSTSIADAPSYFKVQSELLGEYLTITSSGLGAFAADLDWQYEGSASPAGGITTVYRFDGGATPSVTFSVTPAGGHIVVPSITSFSTWFAGNPVAVPVRMSQFNIE